MGKRDNHGNDQKHSKFQWFIIVVLIPSLFALTLVLVILTAADINVFKAAKDFGTKVPIVSNFITDNGKLGSNNLKGTIASLQADLADKDANIKQLENSATSKDSEIKQLKSEIDMLNQKLTDKQKQQAANSVKKKALSAIYETMSSKNAAAIIQKLQDSNAVSILSSVSEDKAAEILANMDPAKAAKYTELIASNK